MYQHELARSGKRLFFIRGTYIYTVIAIAVLIAWTTRDMGPFRSADGDRFWFWLSLGVASLGALVRVFTSGWAALGTSGRAKVAAEAMVRDKGSTPDASKPQATTMASGR